MERFSGTDGKAMKPDELKEVATFSARWLCTKGVIGCFLSHRRIWQKAYPMGRMLPLALQELLAKNARFLIWLQSPDSTVNYSRQSVSLVSGKPLRS